MLHGLRVFAVVLVAVLLVCITGRGAQGSCEFVTQRVQCGNLACDAETKQCIPCRRSADCYPSAMRCDATSGNCVVRALLDVFGFRTVIAMIGGVLVCAVGVIAGVGGGGILVPMFSGLMQLPMETSVALSQSTIVGQCILNLSVVLPKKYPVESWSRPLVNYHYLSLMLPFGLIGTLVGGILSRMCPDILRIILLFVILSAVLYRTIGKMKKQYKADKEAHQEVTIELSDSTAVGTTGTAPPTLECPLTEDKGCIVDPKASKMIANTVDVDGTAVTAIERESAAALGALAAVAAAAATTATDAVRIDSQSTDSANKGGAHGSATLTKAPQPQYPKFEISVCLACFGVLLVFNILRSFCSCGGVMYWLCAAAPLVFLSAVCYKVRDLLGNLAAEQPEMLTFTWNQRNNLFYPMMAVIAGAAAAMLGIGGGLILSFVLYEIGLIPEEASVTGGMATFLIALSSALQLLITGQLLVDFGIAFFFVGVASTALGQFVFMRSINKYGLRYLIVGSLAFMVGGSLVVLTGFGIFDSVVKVRNGGSMFSFGALCQG